MEQNEEEAKWLLNILRREKITSLLEVGSRNGFFFKEMALCCPPGSKVCSIDIIRPPQFEANLKELQEKGYAAEQYIGDSKSEGAVNWARSKGQFDFVFIDGDHETEAVRADWNNYGPMGKLVGFHDIVGQAEGVQYIWAEIKDNYKAYQQITCGKSWMGIGLVYPADKRGG